MRFILYDNDERNVTATITTSTTTKEEIENIIAKMKDEVEDYSEMDLYERLPDDCDLTWVLEKDYIYW